MDRRTDDPIYSQIKYCDDYSRLLCHKTFSTQSEQPATDCIGNLCAIELLIINKVINTHLSLCSNVFAEFSLFNIHFSYTEHFGEDVFQKNVTLSGHALKIRNTWYVKLRTTIRKQTI